MASRASKIFFGFIVALIIAMSAFPQTTSAAVTLSSFTARMITENISARVVMSWTTASEINTAGFNIYRSERADGPYTRINPQLIPAKNDLIAGGTYTYTDDKTQATQTYYYQLEDVELNGTSARHTPIAVNSVGMQSTTDWFGIALGIGALAVIGGGVLLVRRMR
ncbi:MAG: hypothetical protein HZC40_15660 [Chloroflexi bacterium]|nr:hypothetical protein [Chloroflexota bacterium]